MFKSYVHCLCSSHYMFCPVSRAVWAEFTFVFINLFRLRMTRRYNKEVDKIFTFSFYKCNLMISWRLFWPSGLILCVCVCVSREEVLRWFIVFFLSFVHFSNHKEATRITSTRFVGRTLHHHHSTLISSPVYTEHLNYNYNNNNNNGTKRWAEKIIFLWKLCLFPFKYV